MIHDGVELPTLLTIARAAEVLGIDGAIIRQWIENRSVSSVRVNGVVHVLTESIADRLDEETLSRPNQESL